MIISGTASLISKAICPSVQAFSEDCHHHRDTYVRTPSRIAAKFSQQKDFLRHAADKNFQRGDEDRPWFECMLNLQCVHLACPCCGGHPIDDPLRSLGSEPGRAGVEDRLNPKPSRNPIGGAGWQQLANHGGHQANMGGRAAVPGQQRGIGPLRPPRRLERPGHARGFRPPSSPPPLPLPPGWAQFDV